MPSPDIAKPDLTTGSNPGLDQLTSVAAAADQAAVTVENPGAAADPAALVSAGQDYATEANALVDMVVAMIVGYEPKCAQYWPVERKSGVVAAAVPVMEKYNFSLGKIPPEITLLIMAGPPLYQCSKLIAEGMKSQTAKQAVALQSVAVKDGATAMVMPGQETGTAQHSEAMLNLNI
jgi:hypothetical protein